MLNLQRALNRLKYALAFFPGQCDFYISGKDIVHEMLKPPCTRIAPKYIESIVEQGNYLAVKIRSIPVKLLWPKKLPYFDLCKVITECFFDQDSHFYEVPETCVESGSLVLDCGAAEGIFALRVLDRAKKVVIFEPLPTFIESLRATFADYSSKVIVEPYALSDVEGSGFLSGTSLYGSVVEESKGGTPIEITTIDRWCEKSGEKVDFIKGDLEAFEERVLRGAAATIKRDKPKIAITVYHPGNSWRELLAFCQELVPEYSFRIKGLSCNDHKFRPVVLHLWVKKS
jgi:FkbM family methyltransferase